MLLRMALVEYKLAAAFMRGGYAAAKDEAKRRGEVLKEAAEILREDK